MPTFDDTTDEKKAPTAASGTVYAQGTKQQEPTFTPWSSFVAANQGVSDREAGKLKGQVQGDVDKAQGELTSAQDTFNAGIEGNYAKPAKPAPPPRPTSGSTSIDTADASSPIISRAPPPVAAPVVEGTGQELSAFGGNGTQQVPINAQSDQPVIAQQGDTAATQPQTSNPWSSFLDASAAPAAPMAAPAATPGATPSPYAPLSAAAQGGHPAGPVDLEAAAGAPAWASLLGDTRHAAGEADALGDESGVQALLQHNRGSPEANSAFDAALINGQGQGDFRKLSKQYGGAKLADNIVGAEQGSQDAWRSLQNDIQAHSGLNRLATGGRVPTPVVNANKPAPSSFDPSTFSPVSVTAAGGAAGLTGNPADITSDPEAGQWADAMDKADHYITSNKGKVVLAPGASSEGIGMANGSETSVQGINVHTAPGQAPTPDDFNQWWGGATSLAVGDPSIDARTWYALAQLTPAQRAAWFKKHSGG